MDLATDFFDVDGIITSKKNLTLLTTSADCISMLLFDPIKSVIGNVHSGWRGTAKGIIKEAIKKMVVEYECNVKDIICCICPSIRKCCFEVDEEVKNIFYNNYKEMDNIIFKGKFKENKQKYYIDTVQINKNMLYSLGLKKENIIDSNLCTVCNCNMFHSYRADKEKSGRNAAIISLI